MIGTIKIGKSFRGVLNYCLEDKLEYSEKQKLEMEKQDGLQHLNRAEILDFNMCYGNRKELIKQFTDVRSLRPQLSKPVIHISLSFDPGDLTDLEKFRQIGRDFAESFGFGTNQYVSILHKDTLHKHLHIIANRVGFDGKTITDSQSYKRVSQICRELEIKHGMKPVLSPRLFQNKQERLLPRQDQRQEQLKEQIRQNLLKAIHFSDFKIRMERGEIEVINGRGVAFQDAKKVYFKGSELGYSITNIQKILNYSLQQRQELMQRIELTRKQEVKRENWTDREKEKHFLKEYLKSPHQKNMDNLIFDNEVNQLSITKDLRSDRLLKELQRPEIQKQIIQKLLLDENYGQKQRHSIKLRH
jgi:Relaxase/Mobilisation nuclease domain